MNDVKISTEARKAAERIDTRNLHHASAIIQSAINSACRPLVEVLEELCGRVDAWDKAVNEIIGRRSNANMSTVEARTILATHYKEHG